jgi:glutamine amidotransferase
VAAADPAARLNLLATDGTRLVATTWGDTLSVLTTEDGVALASEPWDDDPAWTDVPDRHLVVATPDGVSLEEIACS